MAIAPWINTAVVVAAFLLPLQQGYIHPDEFFQSPEVAAGDVLSLTVHKPWEFDPSFPCRTIVWPWLISGLPYAVCQWLDVFGINSLGSYELLWAPRVACAFLMVFVLKCMTQMYYILTAGRGRPGRLKYAAIFPPLLVFGARPFSNTVEMALFAKLLLDTMPRKDANTSRRFRNDRAWRVGALVVSGFFNRPTFLAFCAFPVFVWLCHMWRTERLAHASWWSAAKALLPAVRTAAWSSSWMLVAFVWIDTMYFNFQKAVSGVRFSKKQKKT